MALSRGSPGRRPARHPDTYQRQRLLDEINAAYGRLKANPEEWEEELDERRAWDNAVYDGIGPLTFAARPAANLFWDKDLAIFISCPRNITVPGWPRVQDRGLR